MFVSEVDVLVRQEQYEDLLREAALERQIRVARLRPTDSGELYRKAANRLGTKMVSWGCNFSAQTRCQPAACSPNCNPAA